MNRALIPRCARIAVLLSVCLAPAALVAQPTIDDVSVSPWLWRWSPVRGIGDLGLPGSRSVEMPRLLDRPSPRIGLSWTAGNPAGLQDDIGGAWTQFLLGSSGASGTFRRPLDPRSANTPALSAGAWRRVNDRIAAVGRVSVELAQSSAGTLTAFVSPYGSSPFIPTDTNGPALRRPTVTIEGGEAIALGRWRLGASAGFHLLENTSTKSAASVIGRSSLAGLTLGISRRVGSTAQVGAQLRLLNGSESVNLFPNPQIIRVYALDGLVGVEPGDYSPGLPAFFRRADRSARAFGLDASGRARAATWSAFARVEHSDEQQVSVVATGAPRDRWNTDGYTIGAAAQRMLRRALLSVRSEFASQRGDAVRTTISGGAYTADASALSMVADVRSANVESRYVWGAVAGLLRQSQTVNDRAARMTADIVAWSPSISAEVGKIVKPRLTVLFGYGVSGFTPIAAIPSPVGRARAYRTLIAPAVELAAAATQTDRVTFAARWWLGAARRRTLTLSVWSESTRARSRPTDPTIPLPMGSRASWGVGARVGAGK